MIIVLTMFGINVMVVIFSVQRRSTFEVMRHLVETMELELESDSTLY